MHCKDKESIVLVLTVGSLLYESKIVRQGDIYAVYQKADHKELLDVWKTSYLLEKDQIATGQRESVKRNEFAKNVRTRTGKGPKRSQEVGRQRPRPSPTY